MAYDDSWGSWREPDPPNLKELDIIKEAKKRFKDCEDWESHARVLFEYDYKFANGDTHNKYQWDADIITARELEDKPILTINKTKVHNLLVINDAKQNKPGIRIRPVGEGASYDGAKIFQELIYHIEYISSAENVYDSATSWQVEAGLGYWRVITDYVSDNSFDQEIFIRRIKDPRSVYLDPNINEVDGSDARFGFVFEDVPKDLFRAKYPEFASVAGSSVLGNTSTDGWITRDNVRVCEYYCKTEKKDKLIAFETPDGQQVVIRYSELGPDLKQYYKSIKKSGNVKERKIVTNDIKWYKIAGDRIIDQGVWLGKYIPIIRLPGTETVIDGIWDVKGHTRALINAQQIYNYNTSANVEYGALQTKSPWLAPADAIEGYEEYYKPLALNTPLPTPNGWTTMGEVKIGDWLFDENGKPVEVIGLSPIHLHRKCYRVEFDDGSHIIADEDHIWTIERRKRKVCNAKDWAIYDLPTKLLVAGKDYIWCAKPLDLDTKQLLIDPYVLGVWLGDGSSASNRISCGNADVDELISNLSNRGYRIGNARKQKTCLDITIHGLRNHLSLLGLLGNKHIPEIYLRSSYEQRLELLQGLMDTDGHYHASTNRCIFVNADKKIIDNVVELIKSLGIKSFVRQFEGKASVYTNGETYIDNGHCTVSFSTELNVFKLNRKNNTLKQKQFNWRRNKRFKIINVIEVPSVPVRCVAINSISHLFLAGFGMVPTHNTANTSNHSYLPYNHMGEDGQPIPPPSRPAAPQASPAYVQQLAISQNEMMMATGQYQSQMGENENAKSGVAINARQRQGDKVTYHFIDNQAIAIRFTGKILIDLIPKIYDTNRVMQILARDGTILNVNIDPNAPEGYKEVDNPQALSEIDKNQKMIEIIFNPKFGLYDIQSDTGPSFATRRQEAFNALTQIAAQNKEFMGIAGDLLWRVADFPEADILAERWHKVIPPNITGDGLPPEVEQTMEKASAQIQQLSNELTKLNEKLVSKERELDIRAQELLLEEKKVAVEQQRADYDAETKRLAALGNSGPGISIEQIQPLVAQLVRGMLEAGEPGSGENVSAATASQIAKEQRLLNGREGEGDGQEVALESPEQAGEASEEEPPIEGARKAKDGQWYVANETGGYSRVDLQ